MNLTELRVGNWVNHKTEGERQFTLEDFKKLSTGESDINDFSPIQLTEEWLLKLGYKVSDKKHTTEYGPSMEQYQEGVRDSRYVESDLYVSEFGVKLTKIEAFPPAGKDDGKRFTLVEYKQLILLSCVHHAQNTHFGLWRI